MLEAQVPTSTAACCRCRSVAISATMRDLPTPASPPTKTTCRAPRTARSQTSANAASSRARPTKVDRFVAPQRAGSGGEVHSAIALTLLGPAWPVDGQNWLSERMCQYSHCWSCPGLILPPLCQRMTSRPGPRSDVIRPYGPATRRVLLSRTGGSHAPADSHQDSCLESSPDRHSIGTCRDGIGVAAG